MRTAHLSNLISPDAEQHGTGHYIRLITRYVLLLTSCAIAVQVGISTSEVYANHKYFEGNAAVETISYTDAVKAAIAQKIDSSKAIFQASLLVMAVLWGLILAKKDERKLIFTSVPEWVMFFIANACFAVSFWCYSTYMDMMAAIHTMGNTADVVHQKASDVLIYDYRDEKLSSFLKSQQYIWCLGIAVSAMVLISAHVLKEDDPCPKEKPTN